MTDEPDGFIGLPPGILPSSPDLHSGTVRRERPDRTRTSSDEIVFFVAGPGIPVPAPVAAPADDAAAGDADAAEAVDDEVVDATQVVVRRSVAAWRLVVPGHGTVTVPGVLFIGRNPSATPGHEGAAVLAVVDAARSLSKTHAMLEIEDGLLWVHDLESTNGVWVVNPAGEADEVIPGQRAVVPSGSTLELGDAVIEVTRS